MREASSAYGRDSPAKNVFRWARGAAYPGRTSPQGITGELGDKRVRYSDHRLGFAGLCVGAAMVVCGQSRFMTFTSRSWPRTEYHSAAKCLTCQRQFKIPLVFRGRGSAFNFLQHASTRLGFATSWLEVVMPPTPADLRAFESAIGRDPVLLLSRKMYASRRSLTMPTSPSAVRADVSGKEACHHCCALADGSVALKP